MTINSINRPVLQEITRQFMAELSTLAGTLGVEISNGGGKYGGNTGSIKIDLSVIDAGFGKSGAEVEFSMWAARDGIARDALGKTFVFHNNKTYKVTGANSGSPKYRFSAQEVHTGRIFKFTAETLKKHFPE